jgi:hypothetical protein
LVVLYELFCAISRCSSGVEHFLGKEEVMGSNPINGSIYIVPAEQRDCAVCIYQASKSDVQFSYFGEAVFRFLAI